MLLKANKQHAEEKVFISAEMKLWYRGNLKSTIIIFIYIDCEYSSPNNSKMEIYWNVIV